MKDLLPIGSVVLLKGAVKRVMICGRIQQLEGQNRWYDYSACLFPEGILDPRHLYVFDNDDIDSVFFAGLQDPEEFQFRKELIDRAGEMGWGTL